MICSAAMNALVRASCVLIATVLLPVAFAQESRDSAGLAQAEEVRELSRAELQSKLAEAQRNLENLVLRIGDKGATPEQLERMRELSAQIADTRAKLDEKKFKVEEAKEDRSLGARWLRFRNAAQDLLHNDVKDGMFRINIGLKLQVDSTAARPSDLLESTIGELENSTNTRRARLIAKGRLFRRMDFAFSWDFAADAGLKDAFLEGGGQLVKFVNWRLGQFKEPFSLSRHTSSNDLAFLEWPLPVAAFAPGRNLGLMLRHTEVKQRLHWAVAAMTIGKETDDNANVSKLTITGRVTGLPVWRDDGRKLVHVGVSFSLREPKGDEARIFAVPEARFLPSFVDTGTFSARTSTLLGVEFAAVRGPLWLQSEVIYQSLESDVGGDPLFGGAYLESGWFLTGESRPYDTTEGIYGRLAPARPFTGQSPFHRDANGGALEITGRWSGIDLNDANIRGGEMYDWSVGLNWYANTTTRFMLNYIYSNVRDSGSANIVLLRGQFSL